MPISSGINRWWYYLPEYAHLLIWIGGFCLAGVAVRLLVKRYRTQPLTQLVLVAMYPFLWMYYRAKYFARLGHVFGKGTDGQKHLKLKINSGWLGGVFRPFLGFTIKGYLAQDAAVAGKLMSIGSVLSLQFVMQYRTPVGDIVLVTAGSGFTKDVAPRKIIVNRVVLMTAKGVQLVRIAGVTPSTVLAGRSGCGKTTAIRSLIAPFKEARKLYVGRHIDPDAVGETLEIGADLSLDEALSAVQEAVEAAVGAEKLKPTQDGLRLILILDEFSNWAPDHRPPKGEPSWQEYIQKIVNEVCRRNKVWVITTTQSGRAGSTMTDSMSVLCGELSAAGQQKTLTGADFTLPCDYSYYAQGFHGISAGIVVIPPVR